MENAPDTGPGKKPQQRANARPSGSTRKPPPVRKAAARRPAPAKPVDRITSSETLVETEEVEPVESVEDAAVEAPEPVVDDVAPVAEGPVAEAPVAEVAEVAVAVEPETEVQPEVEEVPEATGEPGPAEEAEPAGGAEVETDIQVEPETAAETAESAEASAAGEPEVEQPVAAGAGAGASAAAAVANAAKVSGGAVAGWTRRVALVTGSRIATFRDDASAAREARAEAKALAPVVEKPARASKPGKELAAPQELFALGTAPKSKRSRNETVLLVSGLSKRFDDKVAVNSIDLEVKVGAFYGIVGPNGAGKTTTLSMITGLLRPDAGTITVHGSDVWTDTVNAKRSMGVLPDRLRLFDRLTGGQLLYYAGVLRGLDGAVARSRTTDLAHAFGIEEALGRLVSDYSAGMTKKIALAAAMIHSPRLLVLDEPFESVDPVSAATVTEILKKYVSAGGTVVLSSHSMDLVQRICDHVAVIVRGEILADGTMDYVRDGQSLEERFVALAGGRTTVEGLEWLHSFSD